MLDLDMTDLFAGAGGSSTGAIQVPNVRVRIAANHNQVVTDIHAMNHPTTDHAVVDLHQERPSFFPKTEMLWASPECKKWSQANGSEKPAIEEGLFEDPLSDDAKTRSRLLMFDVLRFIEYHRYRLVFVENVVDIATQAKYATAWQVWRQELRALGFAWRVVSLNAMHAQAYGLPAPQSRDRIYIVAWPEGEKAPDLDQALRPKAYCPRCDVVAETVQSWKPRREVGRYRQAYTYNCRTCNRPVEPAWLPAATAIDWTLPGERIGDRLKPKTRARIAAGIAKFWGPMVVESAGNVYDASDPKHPHHGEIDAYYRAWAVEEALRTLHTTNSKALAVPVEARDGLDARSIDDPMRTQTTRLETGLAHAPFMAEMYGTSTARSISDPAGTFTAGGNHHGLVQDPFVLERRFEYRARSIDEPISTLTANDTSKALIHRMNGGGAEMTTPLWEELRTLTAAGNQALLQTERRHVTAAELRAAEEMVPDTLFRMFQPHEVAAGMAFPRDYKWQPPDRHRPVSNRDLVAAAGNAVCPPCSRDVIAAGVSVFGVEMERAA